MSRTVARMIGGVIGAATMPLSRRQREKTVGRVAADIGRRSLREVRTAKGPLKFLALRGAYTATAVERFHQDEPETLEWIDRFVKEGETFWDIGANIGLYALYAALTPGVTVYAFEPSALNFGILTEHIYLNGKDGQVKPLCVALGRETGIGALHMGSFDTGHASNALGEAVTQFREFRPVFSQAIPSFTADGFRRIFSLPAPAHIKLDVDGIEGDILAGAGETLQSVASVLVEVQGGNAKEAAAKIESPLIRAGLQEDTDFRRRGSGRNRLYVRG